jgi:acylphosphatase
MSTRPHLDRAEQVSRRFRIAGKVQGVCFRDSTRMEAEGLAIRGFARNLKDGSVEVVAHGPTAAVERLRQWLHRGPKMARVDSVLELEIDEETPAPASFEIR